MYKISTCTHEGSCYRCNSEKCYFAGHKFYDCPADACLMPKEHFADCDNCEFIDQYLNEAYPWEKQ